MKAVEINTPVFENTAPTSDSSSSSMASAFEEVLRSNRLLQSVSKSDLAALADLGQWYRYDTGDVVSAQGLVVDTVVFVVSGRAKAEIAAPGREKYRAVVNFLGPGEDIGLLSLIDGGSHSASVIALEPLEALSVPSAVMQTYLASHADWYRIIAEIAVSRLRTSGLWMQALI